MITYLIPCGGAKLTQPAPARDLYTGQMFRHTITAAQAAIGADDARVLILSAEHGLVDPDQIVAPYDRKMGDPGCVSAETITWQAAALGIDFGDEVYAFLPASYYRVADEGLRELDVFLQDVYEGTAGIGEQRHVNAVVAG